MWQLSIINNNNEGKTKKNDNFGLFNGLNSFFNKNLKTKIIIFN